MSTLYLVVSHAAAFNIGLYAASQFKFGEPVEIYKWLIAIFFLCFSGILSSVYDKNR